MPFQMFADADDNDDLNRVSSSPIVYDAAGNKIDYTGNGRKTILLETMNVIGLQLHHVPHVEYVGNEGQNAEAQYFSGAMVICKKKKSNQSMKK